MGDLHLVVALYGNLTKLDYLRSQLDRFSA